MKSILVWKKEYEIGVSEIDAEHQIFVKTIQKIDNAFLNNSDRKIIGLLLKELYKYADFHFTSEENIMIMSNYTGYNQHKLEHEKLLHSLTEIISFLDSKYTDHKELIHFLLNWFKTHTADSDTKFGLFLKN